MLRAIIFHFLQSNAFRYIIIQTTSNLTEHSICVSARQHCRRLAVVLFRLLVPGKGGSGAGHASSPDRASTPVQQPRHEPFMHTEHSNRQLAAITHLSTHASQVLSSSLSREHDVPTQPATDADAAAASQMPSADIEPLVLGNQQSHQQRVAASVSRWTDSGSPRAQSDATEVPAQPLEHVRPASSQAGSQEGVVMLLCILSLMPRLPPPPPGLRPVSAHISPCITELSLRYGITCQLASPHDT